jgi:hypothetical protein
VKPAPPRSPESFATRPGGTGHRAMTDSISNQQPSTIRGEAHPGQPNLHSEFGCCWFSWSVGSAWSADGLSGAVVAAGGVDGEGADDLAGGGADDAHVEVGDEHEDAGSVEVSAESDVVESAIDAQGDVAVAHLSRRRR